MGSKESPLSDSDDLTVVYCFPSNFSNIIGFGPWAGQMTINIDISFTHNKSFSGLLIPNGYSHHLEQCISISQETSGTLTVPSYFRFYLFIRQDSQTLKRCTVNRPKEIVPWWFSRYLLSQYLFSLGELSQNLSAHRWIVPMTFCPNAICPKNIRKSRDLSQTPNVPNTFCPKSQMSQLHFVPMSFVPQDFSPHCSLFHCPLTQFTF